ncbi:hypothetical protein GF337_09415, partial [candidate division KSB1 bacterium]|nr:hypothetical protein [candidate division KSB1 bacterium]
MKSYIKPTYVLAFILTIFVGVFVRSLMSPAQYKIYPETNDKKPELSSPFSDSSGDEFVVAVTKDEEYAIIPVTLSNDRDVCKQLIVDEQDFP